MRQAQAGDEPQQAAQRAAVAPGEGPKAALPPGAGRSRVSDAPQHHRAARGRGARPNRGEPQPRAGREGRAATRPLEGAAAPGTANGGRGEPLPPIRMRFSFPARPRRPGGAKRGGERSGWGERAAARGAAIGRPPTARRPANMQAGPERAGPEGAARCASGARESRRNNPIGTALHFAVISGILVVR